MSPLVTKFNRCVTTVSELPHPLSDLLFAEVADRDAASSAVMINLSGDDVAGAPMSVRGYAIVVSGARLVRLDLDSGDPSATSGSNAALRLDRSGAESGSRLLTELCATPAGVAALSPAVASWDLAGASLTPGAWSLEVSCADGSRVTVPSRSEILAALYAGAGLDFPAR